MNLTVTNNTTNNYISVLQNELEYLKEFVKIFKNTTYAKPFEKVFEELNSEGKLERKIKVDEEQMLACIITGRVINLDPITALSYGNTLDDTAIIKYNIGLTLGLTTTTALQEIHIFKNKEGKISKVLSTHLIESILIKNGINIEFIEYFKPICEYTTGNGKPLNEEEIFENGKLKDKLIFLNLNNPPKPEIVKRNQEEGFKYVIKIVHDYRTTIRATRGTIIKEESVTRQDAIDWGMYPGTTSWGEIREETSRMVMWKNRLPRMLAKTALSNVANRIANDLLHEVISDATYSQYDKGYKDMNNDSFIDATIIDKFEENLSQE